MCGLSVWVLAGRPDGDYPTISKKQMHLSGSLTFLLRHLWV